MYEYIGRGLVYTILLFSFVLAVLGVAVFFNQIEWAGSPPPNQVEGIYDTNLKDIQRKQEELIRLRRGWKAADSSLTALEKQRDADRVWYKEQLGLLRTGNGPDAVKSLSYEADGKLKVDDKSRPLMGPKSDPRLDSQKALDAQLALANKRIGEEIAEIQKLLEQQKADTLKLLGEPGKAKGLLALLEQSLKDKKNALRELEAARQEAINGRVSVQVLLARQKQLKERVEELKKFAAAAAAREPK